MHKVATNHRPARPIPASGSVCTKKIRVLAAGSITHREFCAAWDLLDEQAIVTRTEQVHSAAIDPLDYDLLLLFQDRPGVISAELTQRVRHQNPLMGMAVVLGSCCEGEARTGTPLPHCERVFWYQFAPWWQNNVAAWRERKPTSWQQFLGDTRTPAAKLGGLVMIDSTDADSAATLITVCETNGLGAIWAPLWRPRPVTSAPAAGLWVGGQLSDAECTRLRELKKSLPADAPLVVLLDFPRIDRVRIARELGATHVLGKPWRVEQLLACLHSPEK